MSTETESGDETYRHATLLRRTDEDPRNDKEAGTKFFLEGDHSDGHTDRVLTEDGLHEIDSEPVEVFDAPCPMTREDVLNYAEEQARDRRQA